MNTRRLMVVALIVLMLTSAVLIFFRGIVRELIVVPISYIFWVIGTFVRNTNQEFFWVALIIIALLVAYRSMKPQKKAEFYDDGSSPYTSSNSLSPNQGRVSFWATRVGLIRFGPYYQTSLRDAVSQLLLDVLAYRYRLTRRQVEQRVQDGSLKVPPEIRQFLQTSIFMYRVEQVTFFQYVLRQLRFWFLSKFKKSSSGTVMLDPDLARVVQYMEEELEVSYYDHSGR